jgi:hypothetical protein
MMIHGRPILSLMPSDIRKVTSLDLLNQLLKPKVVPFPFAGEKNGFIAPAVTDHGITRSSTAAKKPCCSCVGIQTARPQVQPGGGALSKPYRRYRSGTACLVRSSSTKGCQHGGRQGDQADAEAVWLAYPDRDGANQVSQRSGRAGPQLHQGLGESEAWFQKLHVSGFDHHRHRGREHDPQGPV